MHEYAVVKDIHTERDIDNQHFPISQRCVWNFSEQKQQQKSPFEIQRESMGNGF